MGVILIIITVLVLVLVLALMVIPFDNFYDELEFDSNGIHWNGTKYDDFGYDVNGYDRQGFNINGYNREGRNNKGQYNRIFDTNYGKDGFYNPRLYPIIVTTHAEQRMKERLPSKLVGDIDKLAYEAFCYGKSKRQIKRSSAMLIEEIENRYDGSVMLVYNGYIYVFSRDCKLITVYKNTRIPL